MYEAILLGIPDMQHVCSTEHSVPACGIADAMSIDLDSSFLCASVEIGAIGRLLQYANELALAEPRDPTPLDAHKTLQTSTSSGCFHLTQLCVLYTHHHPCISMSCSLGPDGAPCSMNGSSAG